MAEELREAVERLQSRLLENQDSRKLMKTLRRLGDLPMTVDILVETGVGKTVNSLRKHDQAGDVAKTLVAKWKKLVPQSTDRPSNTKEARPLGHSRSDIGSEGSRKRARDPSPEQAPHEGEMEEEEEEEERGYNTNYSPSPPRHHYSPPQLSHGGGQRGGYQSEGYESPTEEDPELEPSPPPRKETRHMKPHKETSRNHHAGGSHGDRDEERRHRHVQMGAGGSGGGGGGSEGRKRSAEREAQLSGTHKASKHSRHSTPHDSRKEKKGGSDGRQREHRDPLVAEEESEEQFDAPTMSFESFLTYDAPTPTKKKKRPPSSNRPAHTSALTPVPVSSSSSSSSSSKPSKANGSRSKRPEPSPSPMALTPVPEKRRKVVEVVAALPDIPLPAIQPNYRPLPSIDLLTPLSPQRRKVPVSNDEEDAGFTGRRFNSKMVVYSGSKTAYLPKMMSLYDQCIRVLQNNIDSIDEVGGVPFEILEPVLERCTPEQLYRIEECNQCFMADSDELWMRHCQRDFKRAAPQEYESWREMYLRLHDEREERLRMLTQNISSAHANKPKGRQVKMAFVNSVAKPPRDVRRRQEKFGTTSTSTASSTAAAAPIKIRPAVSYSSHSADPPGSSHYSPPQASRSSGGSGGGANAQKDKTQVKKIAPMMAKTIKAFKNRFSRR